MSYGNKALNQYNNVASQAVVGLTSQHRLVQMMMDGFLSKVATAKGQIERNDLPGKSENISAAMSIVNALKMSLDMAHGGEIAANLDDLYGYMYQRLVDANSHSDAGALTEVSSLMNEIKSAWDAIPEQYR